MFMVSFFVSIYYNVIIAWTFFYLFASFRSPLPWSTCNNEWNTPACRIQDHRILFNNCTLYNGTFTNGSCHISNNTESEQADIDNNTIQMLNESLHKNTDKGIMKTKSSSDEYFHNHVLRISSGIHEMGDLRWQIALCLMMAWIAVCVCMIKGIKTSGRAVYFTATFPYLVLTILMIRGMTLPGSVNGLVYFFKPQWEKLLDPNVWGDAAIQIFFSLAPGWGGLITLSSYNKFQNNCLRDTMIVCFGDCITSIFAGSVIFSIIGFMAHELNTDVDKVADQGAGLAFIVYPEVVTRLPASPLWAILFFLMLITLGLGTQFAIVNTVHTTIMDVFPKFFHVGQRKSLLMMAICCVGFTLGLFCCTQGGMFVLQLMDSYSATYGVLVIALTECLVLSWVYGYDQFVADIKLMIGKEIGIYWKITWKYLSPMALVAIICFVLAKFKVTSYGDIEFPLWADMIGWFICMSSVGCIPLGAIMQISQKYQNLPYWPRIKKLLQPANDWGPANTIKPKAIADEEDGLQLKREMEIPLNFSEVKLEEGGKSEEPLNSTEVEIEAVVEPEHSV